MTLPTRANCALIRLYRALHSGWPSPCRYTPSCSQYALEALEIHGFLKGNYLLFRRILRCSPWGSWGADPVPMRESNV